MKKGTLRLLPLQAELNLNKQKVDIEDFAGWNKCNAPVYGNCLSPLYKKNNTHHDFFIGDDNYDFTEGTLYKNGTAVLSGTGSKKLKKTQIAENYSSMKVSESGVLCWARETAANKVMFKIGGQSAVERTIANAQLIYTTKVFGDDDAELYGVVVWYMHTNGQSGYYLEWEKEGTLHQSYGTGSPTLFSNFNITAPLIQVAISNGICVITFFGAYGSNINEVDKKNITIYNNTIYENSTFHDNSTYATRYETVDNKNFVTVEVSNSRQRIELADTLLTSAYFGNVVDQAVTVSLQNVAPSDVTVTMWYMDKNNQKQTAYSIVIPQGSLSVTKKFRLFFYSYHSNFGSSRSGTMYFIDGVGYNSLPTGFFLLPCYTYVEGTKSYSSIGYNVSYLANNAANNPASEGELVTTNIIFDNELKPLSESIPANFFTTLVVAKGISINCIAGKTKVKNLGLNFHSDWQTSTVYSVTMQYIDMTQSWAKAEQSWITNFIDGKNYTETFGNVGTPQTLNVSGFTAGSGAKVPYNTGVGNMGNVTIYLYRKTAYTTPALKECDCVLDDNRCYTIGDIVTPSDEEIPRKIFTLAGTITSFDTINNQIIYTSIATFNITYDSTEDNVFPRYYIGRSLCLQANYLRIVYKFKASVESEKVIYFEIDNTTIRTALGKNIVLFPGVSKDGSVGNQGTCVNIEGWRLLYNNNLLSNVACYENENYIGTILADWLTVDTDFGITCNADVLYYKDNSNKIWKIEKVSAGAEWEYRVIENRYVILNTTNYFNCYDTETGLKRHWASDYNNRVSFGYGFSQYSVNADFTQLLTTELFEGLIATGQNANYERTKDYITSVELGALYYKDCLKDYYYFKSCSVPTGAIELVDVYRGDDGSTAAAYVYSLASDIKFINTDLTSPNAIYPISENGDVRYNPNLFTRFISSYNNKDMVISDKIAYKLLYFNNVIPVMAYYLLDGVEGVEDAFVLQSSYYGVTATRLYQMNYSNGVGVEVVCDITNLEYLGALPTQALFWSAQNRAIYSFKGNCIMALSQYANEVEVILNKWYNPATQELFLDTNIGLLVFSDLGTYCLPKFTVEIPPEQEGEEPTYEERDIKDIFFYPDMFIINLEDDTSYSYYWSYNPKENYESNGVHFVTKYYGNAKTPITVNNIWIRIYNQDNAQAEGEISFKGFTVTDSGFQTDEKVVTIGGDEGEVWDEQTNTMLVKYTPQYNRGLGFSLEVKTTFPIVDIKYDYVEEGLVEGQIAHINI